MALRVLYLACRVQHEYLAAYITELALPEYSALQWLPSIIAAAAVLLARHICAINIPIMRSLQPWSPTLQHYSGYRCALTCSHVYIRNVRLPPRSHTLQHHCGSKCSSRSTAQGISSYASLCWRLALITIRAARQSSARRPAQWCLLVATACALPAHPLQESD